MKPRVDIITPVYNEAEMLPRYFAAVQEILLSQAGYEFRFFLVDDGSRDDSWRILRDYCAVHAGFRGIRLSRNYGSHIALAAGFAEADGDAIATLPCDLQDPPEVILQFLDKWKAGAKIVWGHRKGRGDPAWRVCVSNFFFRIVQRWAMPPASKFTTGSFLLADRKVAECYRRFGETNRITFALIAWTGFDQDIVYYDRQRRAAGVSAWSISRMIRAMYDTFIGFSQVPVRFMTFLGITTSLISFVLAIYVFLCWLTENPLRGWSSQMLMLSGFFGVQFLLMGISGEYLHRIYLEVTRRPLYLVSEETHGIETPNDR